MLIVFRDRRNKFLYDPTSCWVADGKSKTNWCDPRNTGVCVKTQACQTLNCKRTFNKHNLSRYSIWIIQVTIWRRKPGCWLRSEISYNIMLKRNGGWCKTKVCLHIHSLKPRIYLIQPGFNFIWKFQIIFHPLSDNNNNMSVYTDTIITQILTQQCHICAWMI